MHHNADLAILTRRLAAMCAAGVNLAAMLDRLAADAGEPYADVLHQVRRRVCDDGLHFTRALSEHPAYFPPLYLAMVRVGEVAGMLDVAARNLADLLEEDLRLSRLLGRPAGLLDASDDLTPAARAAMLSLFCRTLGVLLHGGVPVLQAMEISADTLPVRERAAWLAVRDRVRDRQPLGDVPFLPVFAQAMVHIGETSGTLDAVMLEAAEAFRREAEVRALEG